MNNETEDPKDNPWDDNEETVASKKPIKKEPEEAENPWAKKDNAIRFERSGGKKPKQDAPFDVFVNQFKKTTSDFKGNTGRGSGGGSNNGGAAGLPAGFNKKSILLAALVGIGLWLSSGFYQVDIKEMAVIVRLGKMLPTIVGEGLHYRLPFPIDREIIRDVSSNNVMNSSGVATISRAREDSDKTLVLTGDENIIHISYTVTWKIKDLASYLFSVRKPDEIILAATESIIREVIGQTDALQALTKMRDEISTRATDLLQKVLDQYDAGVQVVQVQLQKVEAPTQVIDAFNDMQASLIDGDGIKIKAEAYRADIIPKARGEAARILQEAEGYAQEVIARAQGEADRFKAIYTEYVKNPDVAGKRLYIDAMETVLKKPHKTIVDGKGVPGLVPYMNLQKNQPNNQLSDKPKGGQ